MSSSDPMPVPLSDLPVVRTTRLFGGPYDGQHVTIPPGHVYTVIHMDRDAATYHTSQYRQVAWRFGNVAAVDLWIHEDTSRQEVEELLWRQLAEYVGIDTIKPGARSDG